MLQQKNPGVTMTTLPQNRYVYYWGVTGQTLNEKKATPAVENMYANAFQEEMSQKSLTQSQREDIPEYTASGKIKASPEGLRREAERANKAKAEFCQTEIKELQEIHAGTTQAKEWIISSTSQDCLTLLEKWCNKEVKSTF